MRADRGEEYEGLNGSFAEACRRADDAAGTIRKLQFLDVEQWADKPPPERPWAVRDRVPLRQVTLLTGEGATGKSILMLQLAVATALGTEWVGSLPEPGHVIY